MNIRPRSLARQLTFATGLQLTLVAGSLSILGFSIGRNLVIEQKEAHRADLPIVRVSERLSSKLSFPLIINQLNESAIYSDPKILKDFDKLSLRFWRQLRSFPVDYINYGSEDGSFLGIEKSEDGDFFHNEDSDRLGRGKMFIYSMSTNGERLKQEDVIPGMSVSHQEAWYVDTAKAGKPTWSQIYAWEDQPETFSISYNAPIFDGDQKLVGVVGVDMIINKLSTWLKDAWKDQSGLAIIVEKNGDVVASSDPSLVLIRTENNLLRSNINGLKSPLAQTLSDQFFPKEDDKQIISENTYTQELVKVSSLADSYYITKATPWGQEFGLEWFLITATPADKAFGMAERNVSYMVLISLAALLVTLAINRRVINTILTPLGALTLASQSTEQQISDSNQNNIIDFSCDLQKTNVKEFLDLHQDIMAMVTAFNCLTQDLKEQEKQIIELFEDKQAKDRQALSVMSEKLKTSLEASSIAHEINQPLSILKLTSQTLINSLDHNNFDQSEMRRQLSMISAQSQRIVLITDKVRAFLRNAQTKLVDIDLKPIILSAIHYINSNYQDSHGWIDSSQVMSAGSSKAMISGDAIQLQIAIINICKNSIEALKESKTLYPQIKISLKEDNNAWMIEIEDNGDGLSPEITFQTLLNSSKPDGSGLGLFIVQSAMESHNGNLSLRSSSSGGVIAQLSIPKSPQSS
jgi:C4-dicarboxylate-specific signal transduction histidine kinase